METHGIEYRVSEIVTKSLIKAPPDLTVSSHLIKLGVLDSLGVVRIATDIGKEFGIELKNSDVNPRTFSTIEKIVELVEAYLEESGNNAPSK